jgi:pSer/pThr/pTyr-binding forkhead associated (FHA) protein
MLEPTLSFCVRAQRIPVEVFVAENPDPVFIVEAFAGAGDDADTELGFKTLAPGSSGGAPPGRSVARIKKRKGANHFGMMVTIGRAKNNDIQIPAGEVSKFHAYVMFAGGQACISDAGSTGGTRVGDKVLQARKERVDLSDGDRVYLGNVQLTYLSPAAFHAWCLKAEDA